MARERQVEQLVVGQPTTDGAGVKLTRVLTHSLQQRLDPFLMLDHFANEHPDDYMAGFPDHPHRGFETITYMLAGRMRHRDSAGHEGLLGPGAVQWMTTGKGLVHSEPPEQSEGRMEGFQLWLNLPGRDKMCAPSYRDIPSTDIPEFQVAEGVRVRAIAGRLPQGCGAVARPAKDFPTDVLYLDVHFSSDQASFAPLLPSDSNAFVYVYRGALHIGPTLVPEQRLAVLDQGGDCVVLKASSSSPTARALLIAGQPLHEPIAQYGPFVMNTRDELVQAVHDFQNGLMG
jgi:quercetin 2,3-dioxygenase